MIGANNSEIFLNRKVRRTTESQRIQAVRVGIRRVIARRQLAPYLRNNRADSESERIALSRSGTPALR